LGCSGAKLKRAEKRNGTLSIQDCPELAAVEEAEEENDAAIC